MSQNHDVLLTRHFSNVTLERCDQVAHATAQLVTRWHAQPSMARRGIRLWLRGELGAGKTTWVRSFLQACGITGRIKSPSFSVVESYEHDGRWYHHLDFYRQSDPNTWQSAGLRDIIGETAVTLIEWPERAHGLPEPHIQIGLGWSSSAQGDTPREITMAFFDRQDGPGLQPLLAPWSAQCG